MDRSYVGPPVTPRSFLSPWCASHRGHMGCQDAAPPLQGSPVVWGQGLHLVAGTRPPQSLVAPAPTFPVPSACSREEAGTPGPLSLGSLPATTAAPLAFWRVFIGQDAQPPSPPSPAVSRPGTALSAGHKGARAGCRSAAPGEGLGCQARPVGTDSSERGSL